MGNSVIHLGKVNLLHGRLPSDPRRLLLAFQHHRPARHIGNGWQGLHSVTRHLAPPPGGNRCRSSTLSTCGAEALGTGSGGKHSADNDLLSKSWKSLPSEIDRSGHGRRRCYILLLVMSWVNALCYRPASARAKRNARKSNSPTLG